MARKQDGARERRDAEAANPGWRERISIDPGVQGGKPVIAGTRVPVEVILSALAAGTSIADVCEAYPLAEPDVRAALMYATEALAEETVHALPGR